jgi:hypothetical protein
MSGILQAVYQNLRAFTSAPVNTTIPTISGTVSIGQVLTSSTGTWTGNPTPTYAYQWQKGVSNISGATSSTYTVLIGDVGSTLRCVVTATNSVGSASANSANTIAVPTPTLGSALSGGYYGGQISTSANGVATHYLIVGPISTAESTLQAASGNFGESGTQSVIDGPANTTAAVGAGFSHPAASFCENLTTGGYSDWYMPAKNELDVLYYGLKPDTTSNNTSAGVNANSVPKRTSTYTSGTPAQTSAAAFQTGGAQAFTADKYWTSTTNTYSTGLQNWQYFSDGGPGNSGKLYSFRVRAIRRIAV